MTPARALRPALAAALLTLCCAAAQAELPWGWNPEAYGSAYTLGRGEISFSGQLHRVNDTLDVLNVRDDLLAANRRLTDDTGDLAGTSFAVSAGVTDWLTVFYQQTDQELTIKIADDDRIDLDRKDEKLDTRRQEWGLRWNLYESGQFGRERPWTAFSLEVSGQQSQSDPYGADLVGIRVSDNFYLRLNPQSRFAVDRMEDSGWRTRLLLTRGLTDSSAISLWGGYGEFDSQSGTSSETPSRLLRPSFEQEFTASETHWMAGGALHWQITPRIPLHLAYEYTAIRDRTLTAFREEALFTLPSILRPDNLLESADNNHVIRGTLSWWLTPQLRAGVTGHLYANQFTGVMPHFNNPLSSSLSETVYGYAGIEIAAFFGLSGF
ncbi:MAG: hypothetical protein WEB57_05475 [Pseudohongiellaceae bacterium]